MQDRTIQFYVPYQMDGLSEIPDDIERYWDWSLNHASVNSGKYNWTLQTYLYLKDVLPCRIVHQMPRKGIVIAHKDFLHQFMWPFSDIYLVCIKPDRKPHSWAHFHIAQNRDDKYLQFCSRDSFSVLPFWPQPSLMPRNPERGARCENVAYFGRLSNLADELKSEEWKDRLNQLGFRWWIIPKERWNDYSDIDVTVSIRSFNHSSASAQNPVYDTASKPFSKLINSWRAGVPAILGPETAYQQVRRHELDYIEVRSVEELVNSLLLLKDNSTYYNQMARHGLKRAREFSVDDVVAQWKETIVNQIYPAFEKWCALGRPARYCHNALHLCRFLLNRKNLADLVRSVRSE